MATEATAIKRARARFTVKLSPRARALSALALLLAFGGLLSALNVPLAASAANSVAVMHIVEAVPQDPESPLWERAQEAEIALSAQQIYQPGGGTTPSVRVAALEDGRDFAVRVSWDDTTKNDITGDIPSDSVAIQLPIDPTHLPYQCMGQSTSRVNIWQWKAALEREAEDNLGQMSVQIGTGGARNLSSNGICRAVDAVGIEPKARSFHDGKAWHVVFHRALSKGDAGTAPIVLASASSIAFAVWNGARGEARGMKAVSTWNALTFTAPAESNVGNLVTLGAVILASAGAVAYAMRRMAG